MGYEESFITMKLIWHSYLVFSLVNCVYKTPTETRLIVWETDKFMLKKLRARKCNTPSPISTLYNVFFEIYMWRYLWIILSQFYTSLLHLLYKFIFLYRKLVKSLSHLFIKCIVRVKLIGNSKKGQYLDTFQQAQRPF